MANRKNGNHNTYIKPVVTRVKLDPEQAILANCKVGGHYMVNATICSYGTTAGGGHPCNDEVRGQSAAGTNHKRDRSETPS